MTVTLITGDKVTVQPDGGVTVARAAGREYISFQQAGGGLDDIRVVPSDAGQLVAEGKLDDRLFDVSYLIKEGYDDASRADMPLLIDGQAATVRAVAGASRVAGSRAKVTRQLSRLGLSAVAQDKKTATALWSQLTTPAKGSKAAKDSSRAVLPAGVERVVLDGKLHITLDRSVPQVAAPAAWEAGFDGTGTTVAVLDTGVDTTHPDLVGKVAAERNFTSEPTAADGNGHGTHVASTVAGAGVASGGKYKGVAPGAALMNGKVCNRGGFCAASWILAGMEWAATSGADVINMSLGGPDQPGIDLYEEAVNRLTAQTGALFVISAGNEGQSGAQTIASPGSADAALTVAAVDKSDKVADFSSRGPRVGDGAVKPDIAAPGVEIVAARAAGTRSGVPGNDQYTMLSGTSMSAPHVAGGAAILAQRHPDWTAMHLKAGLMGSATPLDGAKVFEGGTGRMDVLRAVTQQVHATTGSVSFGLVEYPYDAQPAPETVSYRNDGATAVTLNLALSAVNQDGAPAPAGMFSLDTTSLTVPAGGTATATVSMRSAGATTGTYGGRITATGDGQVVQTAVGVHLEPESYNLTVNLLDREGRPPTAVNQVYIHDYATRLGPLSGRPLPSGITVRLPKGSYMVYGCLTWDSADPDKRRLIDDWANMAHPEVKLTQDTVVTLDARQARKVEVSTDRTSARPLMLYTSMMAKLPPGPTSHWLWNDDAGSTRGGLLPSDVYVGSVGSTDDKFIYATRAQLTEPLIRLDINGTQGGPVDVAYADDVHLPGMPLLGTHRLGVVHGGGGTVADLARVDARGKLVVLDLPPAQDTEFIERIRNVKQAGGRAVLLDRSPIDIPCLVRSGSSCRQPVYARRSSGNLEAPGAVPELPVLMAKDPQRTRLVGLARQGTATVTTRGVKTSPYQYNLVFPTKERVPDNPVYRARNSELGVVEVDTRHTVVPNVDSNRTAFVEGRSLFTGATGFSFGPYRRTEYYSPGPITWQRKTNTWNGDGLQILDIAATEYVPGRRNRVAQWHGVIGPGLPALPDGHLVTRPGTGERRPEWVYREGDTLRAQVPMFNDSQPGRYSEPYGTAMGARLYRNGTLIKQEGGRLEYNFAVPPGLAEYRLEIAAEPRQKMVHSTRIDAAWTFTSDTTSKAEALPLMAVRYKPTLDDYNRGPAAKKVSFPVWVEQQSTATQRQVTELTVEASFDDGVTWRPVQLRRDGGDRWTATLTNPYSGFVTLRATATDADGNTVNQTIKRAYSVRP